MSDIVEDDEWGSSISDTRKNNNGEKYPIRTVNNKASGWKVAKRAPPPSAPAPYKNDIIKEKRDFHDIENHTNNNNETNKEKPKKYISSSLKYLDEEEKPEDDDNNREFRKPRFSSTNSSLESDRLRSSLERSFTNDNNDSKYIKNNSEVSGFGKYADDEEKKGNILPRKSGKYDVSKSVSNSIEIEDDLDQSSKYNSKPVYNESSDDGEEEEDDDDDDDNQNYHLSNSPEVKLDQIYSDSSRIKELSDDSDLTNEQALRPKISKSISFVCKAHRRGVRTDLVQCTIIRDRTGMTGGRLFPTYELINEATKNTILLAKKMNMNRTSNYHFFDMTRGAAGSKLTKKSGNYLGKLRARNIGSTEYVLLSKSSVAHEELAAFIFDRLSIFEQLKEGSQPRKMSVALPPLDSNDCPIPQPLAEDGSKALFNALNGSKKDFKMYYLETKDPVFENGNFRLNFGGRVTIPSVKNFQLVHSHDIDDIICQFGKVGDERFHIDYKAPLNALQAFACAICQFNL